MWYADYLSKMGRHAEAVAACRKAIGLDPYYPRGHWFLAPALEQKRELPATIAEPEKMVAISRGGPLDRALPGHAYARAGERTKAFGIPEELKALSEQRYVSPLDIATVHTGLAIGNLVFEWLEKAYQERTMRIQELPQPIFDGLRGDPAFAISCGGSASRFKAFAPADSA
jgi:tetratricopeptide (TPR) repeat protein